MMPAKQLLGKVGQNNFWEKLGKTTFGKSWAKSVATRSVAVWLHLFKGGLGEKP
jgi:putative copper export protein